MLTCPTYKVSENWKGSIEIKSDKSSASGIFRRYQKVILASTNRSASFVWRRNGLRFQENKVGAGLPSQEILQQVEGTWASGGGISLASRAEGSEAWPDK